MMSKELAQALGTLIILCMADPTARAEIQRALVASEQLAPVVTSSPEAVTMTPEEIARALGGRRLQPGS